MHGLQIEKTIVNDVMHESNFNYMGTIGYEMNSDLSSRVNPDNNINDNGTKLLTLLT